MIASLAKHVCSILAMYSRSSQWLHKLSRPLRYDFKAWNVIFGERLLVATPLGHRIDQPWNNPIFSKDRVTSDGSTSIVHINRKHIRMHFCKIVVWSVRCPVWYDYVLFHEAASG